MRRLRVITPEEQRILDGGAVDKAAYTARAVFTVDSEKLLERGGSSPCARTHGLHRSPDTHTAILKSCTCAPARR